MKAENRMSDKLIVHPVAFPNGSNQVEKIHALMIISSNVKIPNANAVTVHDLKGNFDPPGKFKQVGRKKLTPINETQVPYTYRLSVSYVFSRRATMVEPMASKIAGAGAGTIGDLSFSIDIGGVTLPTEPEDQILPIVEIDPCAPLSIAAE